MPVFVALTFRRTIFASLNAGFQHGPKDSDVLAGSPYRKPGGCIADIRAVQTTADALTHIHLFR